MRAGPFQVPIASRISQIFWSHGSPHPAGNAGRSQATGTSQSCHEALGFEVVDRCVHYRKGLSSRSRRCYRLSDGNRSCCSRTRSEGVDGRINAGWLLPDFLLGWFVLAGLESYAMPNDYPSAHYLLFTFPWSHGLLTNIAWAAIAGAAAWRLTRRRTAAVAVAGAVLSHFLLDGIVQRERAASGRRRGTGVWAEIMAQPSAGTFHRGRNGGIGPLDLSIRGENRWLHRWVGMAVYIVALAAFLNRGSVRRASPSAGALSTCRVPPPSIDRTENRLSTDLTTARFDHKMVGVHGAGDYSLAESGAGIAPLAGFHLNQAPFQIDPPILPAVGFEFGIHFGPC